ncbi:nucleolar protein 12-domain-containing protein [Parachaetomium inaequale]|uniref:Nucleolar protein 12-domain-containing protein n=1 Tax=Parachaetomium inaequale TaxID=2588326 RepID=A0AAN6PFL5_9PEZI|nr:nucleolar protein 12-domain-containing protein [Parachaetomium inaequale]
MFAQPRIRKTAPPPPKKRKTAHAIEEITFDKDARSEYLTGFHKRKQARIKHAQEVAAEKAREERIEMRKQIREDRKQAVEDHVQAINKILREAEHAGTAEQNQNGSGDEWGGLSDTDVVEAPIDLEEEYIDEDKYTTVTVEAVSVDRDGLHKPELEQSSEDEGSEQEDGGAEKNQRETGKRPKDHPTKKKKKFRYENKVERRVEAQKQRAKRRKR